MPTLHSATKYETRVKVSRHKWKTWKRVLLQSHKIHPWYMKYQYSLCSPTCWNWFNCSPHRQAFSYRIWRKERSSSMCWMQRGGKKTNKQNRQTRGDEEHEGRSGQKLRALVPSTHIDAPGAERSRSRLSNRELPEFKHTINVAGSTRIAFAAKLKLNAQKNQPCAVVRNGQVTARRCVWLERKRKKTEILTFSTRVWVSRSTRRRDEIKS